MKKSISIFFSVHNYKFFNYCTRE